MLKKGLYVPEFLVSKVWRYETISKIYNLVRTVEIVLSLNTKLCTAVIVDFCYVKRNTIRKLKRE